MEALVMLHMAVGITYTEMLEMTAGQLLALFKVIKKNMSAIKAYKSLMALKGLGGL